MSSSRASENKLRALISSYWRTPAIYGAAKLGLADKIAAGADRPETLAAETGTHARSLYRLLRALATIGIFAEEPDGRFSLTPMADCLRGDHPGPAGVGHHARRGTLRLLRPADRRHPTGEVVFDKIFGAPVFDYLAQNPEQARTFDEAMVGVHGQETIAMLKAYDFSPFGVLADIGGGNGSLLAAVLKKHKSLQGHARRPRACHCARARATKGRRS